MKKKVLLPLFFLAFMSLTPGIRINPANAEGGKAHGVRPAILAGTWYPGSKKELRDSIRVYLSKANPELPKGKLKALIVPHAGYIYSGQVAAYAYRLIEKSNIKMVIMVGFSHRYGFKGISVNLQSGYQTPLGTVPVDREFARALISSDPLIKYVPEAHAREHSLEIQVPFLQMTLQDFSIVPIVVGQGDFEVCSILAEALAINISKSDNSLMLASTDLSHFYTYSQANALDSEFIKHIKAFDPEGLKNSLFSGKSEACGALPSITVLLAARRFGADSSMILKYANSGDVTGDHRRVVGYLSAAFYKKNEPE